MARKIEDKDLEKVSGAGDPVEIKQVSDSAQAEPTDPRPGGGGGGGHSDNVDADAGGGSGTPGGTTTFGQN